MMKVSNEIEIYEHNGKETPMIDHPVIVVQSHWNRSNMVVLVINGEKYTVIGSELSKAIDNARNTDRY